MASFRCLFHCKPIGKRADLRTLPIGSAPRHPILVSRDPEDGVLLEAEAEIAGDLEGHLHRPPKFRMARCGIVTGEAPHPETSFKKFVFEFEIRRSVPLVRPGLASRRLGGDDGELVRAAEVRPGTAEADIEVGGMEVGVFHDRGSPYKNGVYCWSANLALPKGYAKHHVFFKDEASAIAAGYRPCGHCLKPCHQTWKTGGEPGTEAYPWRILPKEPRSGQAAGMPDSSSRAARTSMHEETGDLDFAFVAVFGGAVVEPAGHGGDDDALPMWAPPQSAARLVPIVEPYS